MITSGIYDTATGRILRTYRSSKLGFIDLQVIAAGEASFEGDHTQEENYIDIAGPIVASRLPLVASWDKDTITAGGVDEAVLSGLPAPCDVYVDGVVYNVLDGSLELTALSSGIFHVIVDEVEFLREEWFINAA